MNLVAVNSFKRLFFGLSEAAAVGRQVFQSIDRAFRENPKPEDEVLAKSMASSFYRTQIAALPVS